MHRNHFLLAATSCLLSCLLWSPSSRAAVVWRGDFETGDISQWDKAQSVSPDRLQVVTSPVAQGRYALRAEVRSGDDPISASGNRNELVYLSYEPKGTERYYRWQTMFAPDYPIEYKWQLFTQWHHSGSNGSPPVEFTVWGDEIDLGILGESVYTAPLARGTWHDFIFHVMWSSDASEGFIELWHNGKLVLPKRATQTQFAGQENYLKQGLYRSTEITATGVAFHDGFVVGTALADVWPEAPGTIGGDAGVGSDPTTGVGEDASGGGSVTDPAEPGAAPSADPAASPPATGAEASGETTGATGGRQLRVGCSAAGAGLLPSALWSLVGVVGGFGALARGATRRRRRGAGD